MTNDKEKAACKRKVRYGSDAAAQSARKKINPTKKLKMPSRVYKCPICSGWHLTSLRKT